MGNTWHFFFKNNEQFDMKFCFFNLNYDTSRPRGEGLRPFKNWSEAERRFFLRWLLLLLLSTSFQLLLLFVLLSLLLIFWFPSCCWRYCLFSEWIEPETAITAVVADSSACSSSSAAGCYLFFLSNCYFSAKASENFMRFLKWEKRQRDTERHRILKFELLMSTLGHLIQRWREIWIN